MPKDLIIVESPAKVKTIKKFLGKNYEVEASVGHVRDLPTSSLGVDEENDFTPQYQVIDNKQKVVSKLRSAAKSARHVFLAPDPDREGEAIAWHVAELIQKDNQDIQRIQFNEITAKAVREALEHPRELNRKLFDSQQARRILDRLVGYKISPLLWSKVKRGISAGRVQSVALRLVVEREKERQRFTPEEYWVFKADLTADKPPLMTVDLFKVDNKKPKIGSEEEAVALEDHIKEQEFIVSKIEEKERSRTPPPPFITSTLQQMASQRLGYSAKKTMSTAQRLYEGVDLGEKGAVALITYMRTDSVRIADEARDAAKAMIIGRFGKEYYPAKSRVFKTKAQAQDAHEAVRPVDVNLDPEEIKHLLPKDQYHLYKLIWERFVASQMAAARFWDTTVTIDAGRTQWRIKGERLLFPGFLAVAQKSGSAAPELPELAQGQKLDCKKIDKQQKFTQPPARYSEASIIRELEEKGIGRPSTYAAIISTIIDRDYVRLVEKNFIPTDLGVTVSDMLSQHFFRSDGRGVHRQHGEFPGQGRRGRRQLGGTDARLHRYVLSDAQKSRKRNGQRQGRSGDQHRLRPVRQAHGHQIRQSRTVSGLYGLPRMQKHQGFRARRQRRNPDSGTPAGRSRGHGNLSGLRRRPGAQARTYGQPFHRLLQLSQVQAHRALQHRRQMSA